MCYISSQNLQPVPGQNWNGQSTVLLHLRQAGSAEDSQRRMPWWIPQWSMITPQSVCIPFLTGQCLALELRIYLSKVFPPLWATLVFSVPLTRSFYTAFIGAFLVGALRARLCFPGTAAPSRASSDMCSPRLCPREHLPATAEKNRRQK